MRPAFALPVLATLCLATTPSCRSQPLHQDSASTSTSAPAGPPSTDSSTISPASWSASSPPSTNERAARKGTELAQAACAKYTVQTSIEGIELPANWVEAQRCVFDGQGAWRIELHELSVSADDSAYGCPSLVHIRSDGGRTARFLPHPTNVTGCRGQDCWAPRCETFQVEYSSGLDIGNVFDWDDDGQTEAALSAWINLSRGRSSSRVVIIDDAGSSLRHLPSTLSLTIVDTKDVDSDGRPDFLLGYSSGTQTDQFGIVSAETLELVAHSLAKGNVSVVDEQAKRYAASRCPEVQLDRIADEVSLLCAKLRGTPRGVAIEAFRTNCKGEQHGGCGTDPDDTWDRFRPPFTL